MIKKTGFIFILVLLTAIYFFLDYTKILTRADIQNVVNNDKNTQLIKDLPAISVYAKNLDVPWSMAFLPDTTMLITERAGILSLIDKNGKVTKIADIPAQEISEGGLLGVAVDPEFQNNNQIYLYFTYNRAGENTLNRVVKYILSDGKLSNEEIIVDNIPGAPNHDGGRIKFGPDGFLYITTGDAQEPSSAQDKGSLAGKILRVTSSGEKVSDNPFGSPVYSYGHRNPQGIAWSENGDLWSTEHGRSGAQSGLDELNSIEKGVNYGWPTIEGTETRENMVAPIINSGANDTWAPGGMAIKNDIAFFGGLRGQALYVADISKNTPTLNTYLKGKLGRIRDVVLGPDGMIYIATSNRDGRGVPLNEDDKILRINPDKLSEL